jgi:hypothetical protein
MKCIPFNFRSRRKRNSLQINKMIFFLKTSHKFITKMTFYMVSLLKFWPPLLTKGIIMQLQVNLGTLNLSGPWWHIKIYLGIQHQMNQGLNIINIYRISWINIVYIFRNKILIFYNFGRALPALYDYASYFSYKWCCIEHSWKLVKLWQFLSWCQSQLMSPLTKGCFILHILIKIFNKLMEEDQQC